MDLQFRARCSRCSNSAFPVPDRLDLGADFRCKACGHSGKLVEFADVATLDAILEALKRRTVGDPAFARREVSECQATAISRTPGSSMDSFEKSS